MAESKKQTVIMTCSIVGCIVTLITCGVLIGGMKTEVVHLKEGQKEAFDKLQIIEDKQTGMETKQAFLEGVVSTKLDNLTKGQTGIHGKLASLDIRMDKWEATR
jgi:hypothetical protein